MIYKNIHYPLIVTFLFLLVFSQTKGQKKVDLEQFQEAISKCEQGNHLEAIKIYDQLIQADADLFGAYYNRALCFMDINKPNKAIDDLLVATQIYPEDSLSYVLLGLNYHLLGDVENSITYYHRAESNGYNGDDSFFFNFNVGTNYLWLNNNKQAATYLQKSYNIDSTDRTVATNLGFALLDSLPEQACFYFGKAYEMDTLHAEAINNFGYSNYLCGKLDEAFLLFNKSKDIKPDNSFVYRNIALYHKAKGQKKLACKNLKKALRMGFIETWGAFYLTELMEYCE